jgi:hypothetical protein
MVDSECQLSFLKGGMVNKYYTFDKDGNEIASGSIE